MDMSILNHDESMFSATKIPIDEQKKYLKRHIDSLSIADKKSIGDILISNNKRCALNFCVEGTIINLDILPENIITEMYELLHRKVTDKAE